MAGVDWDRLSLPVEQLQHWLRCSKAAQKVAIQATHMKNHAHLIRMKNTLMKFLGKRAVVGARRF
jgi:hypothetical protein